MAALEHPERRPAVLTGASSGLGRAIAVALRTAGGEAVALPLDLNDGASVEAFAKEAEAAQGPTEVLVSCAGDVQPGGAVDMLPEAPVIDEGAT